MKGALPSVSEKWSRQMRKGLAELCVLASLREEEAYGYAILKKLSVAGGLSFTESTIYPVLAKLADEGDVIVRSAESPAGPVRRYYRLTAKGRRRLSELSSYWRELRDSVDAHLEG
jgi:PadR family transcriptional regulator PadR